MWWRALQRNQQPLLQSIRQTLSQCSKPVVDCTNATKPTFCDGASYRLASSAAVKTEETLYGGQTLQQIRARVFGEHIGNGLPSGRKLLRKKLMGEQIAGYYGSPDLGRSDPFLEDERAAAKKAKLDRLARRGKGPPKKGEGKRAKRK